MHETIIASEIIKEAESHGKVKEIYLEIGEIAPVPAEELVDCITTLTGWKVIHKEIASIVRCQCGYKGRAKIIVRGHDSCLIECQKCKMTPDIISGKEIKVTSVVVD